MQKMWIRYLLLNRKMTIKKRVDFFPHNYFTKYYLCLNMNWGQL